MGFFFHPGATKHNNPEHVKIKSAIPHVEAKYETTSDSLLHFHISQNIRTARANRPGHRWADSSVTSVVKLHLKNFCWLFLELQEHSDQELHSYNIC